MKKTRIHTINRRLESQYIHEIKSPDFVTYRQKIDIQRTELLRISDPDRMIIINIRYVYHMIAKQRDTKYEMYFLTNEIPQGGGAQTKTGKK